MRWALLSILAACVQACGAPCLDADAPGVMLRFADPGARLPDFLAHPWPSDARKKPSGQLDLDAFPNPTGSSTLDDYKKVIAQNTRAYGTSAALYLSFTGALDADSLPVLPEESMDARGSLQLIDIDPASPERGRRYPLKVRFQSAPTTYLPPNHVALLPPFGVPLSGGTRYALIGRGLRDAAGNPVLASKDLRNAAVEGCTDDAPPALASLLAPLREFLADTEEDAEAAAASLVVATVFTTQNALAELRALAEVARAQPVPVLSELSAIGNRPDAVLLKGQLELPAFQMGTIPYAQLGDGGALALDAGGRPMLTHQELTRVSLVIPKATEARPMPPSGWPVVIFSHGTGGDYRDAYDEAVADVLGKNGIAVLGYDQTLHGPRDPTGGDPRLTFFNLFNPIAGRDNVRQGAADSVALAKLLASGLTLPAELAGGSEARFDRERIGWLGHSQGSLVGALAAAIEPRLKAVAFSGPGGVLGIALLERKDIVDFSALLSSLLSLPPEEKLDQLHPVIHLIQTFIEPADPVSYARSYLHSPAGAAPPDMLWIEGLLDEQSPARGQEAYATAAGAPVLEPVARLPEAAALVGPEPQPAPQSANVEGAGGRATFGLIQYPQGTHFPIYEDADANARYAEFLRSALYDGRARILAPR